MQAIQVTLVRPLLLHSFSTTICEANDVNVLEHKIQKGLHFACHNNHLLRSTISMGTGYSHTREILHIKGSAASVNRD